MTKYYILSFFWKLFSLIPFRIMFLLADILYYPFYYLVKYRRQIARKNLLASFPEKSLSEIIKIEKKFYRYFLEIFLETCKVATISKKEMGRRMKFMNVELINDSNSRGKSVSLYLAHYGNWEWISSLNLYVYDYVAGGQIYQKMKNKPFEKLMLKNRNRFGTANIEMNETLRWINDKIQKNIVSTVGYIADQSPKIQEVKHFLHFLNHTVPIFIGTERIVKKYDMDAYYLDIKRVKRGYYETTFVKMHENPKSLPDFELTQIFFNLLESSIKNQPEIYLWTHNRFKHAKK